MICGLLGFGMVGRSQVVWSWVSWVANGCDHGFQVRFLGLQMGVAVGLRCVWNGSQRVHSG